MAALPASEPKLRSQIGALDARPLTARLSSLAGAAPAPSGRARPASRDRY
jgi:hypothetical protein